MHMHQQPWLCCNVFTWRLDDANAVRLGVVRVPAAVCDTNVLHHGDYSKREKGETGAWVCVVCGGLTASGQGAFDAVRLAHLRKPSSHG